ncbi:MAG: type II toxin-antitoxin system HicA family toxin [Planctomycetota bacterium]|nr:type II toxin-antitoxin system HicA family toxin [Planctomycetota bacterium]
MKKKDLVQTIQRRGAVFLRHGGNHDVYVQPATGRQSAVPRHNEINEMVAKSIIKNLSAD